MVVNNRSSNAIIPMHRWSLATTITNLSPYLYWINTIETLHFGGWSVQMCFDIGMSRVSPDLGEWEAACPLVPPFRDLSTTALTATKSNSWSYGVTANVKQYGIGKCYKEISNNPKGKLLNLQLTQLLIISENYKAMVSWTALPTLSIVLSSDKKFASFSFCLEIRILHSA